MKSNRFVCVIFSLILALNTAPCFAEAETLEKKTAEITVASGGFKLKNAQITYGGFSVQNIDGVDYAVSNGSGNDNIYINIPDKYWYCETGEPAMFEVEYLDKGNCSFTLHYCNDENKPLMYEEVVQMENTGELKKIKMCIDDFTAKNGCADKDVRLRTCGWTTGCSGGKIYIKSIKIIQGHEYFIDVRAENGEYGRIFDYGKDEMTFTIFNDTDLKVKTDINWRVKNNENRLICSGVVKDAESGGGKAVKQSFHTKAAECGTYYLEFDVVSTGGNGFYESYSRTLDFSVARTMQPGDKQNSVFGANIHSETPFASTANIDTAQRMGIRTARMGYNWDELEKSIGVYNVTGTDYQNKLAECGMSSVKLLSRANPLYNGNRATNIYSYDDKALEAYGNAAAYVSGLNTVEYVEILNEYNHVGFNAGDRSPESYLLYCKAAYEAIKKVNPESKVVIGNLAGYDIAFMIKLFELGGFDYCDAVSLHPYQSGEFDQGQFRNQMETILAQMKKYNVKKEIVLTEMGITRATDGVGVPEGKRRIYAPVLMLMAQGEKLADLVLWYDFVDDGTCENQKEHQWGLVKFPTALNKNTATDTFVTLAAMSNLVQDGEPTNVLRINGDTTTAYNFKRSDGKNIVAAWTTQKSDTLALNLGCDSAKMYNVWGTYLGEIKSSDGVFTIGLCDEIVYLEGNFNYFEEVDTIVGFEENTVSAVRGDTLILNSFDKLGRDVRIDVDYDGEIFTPIENSGDSATLMFKINENALDNYHMTVAISNGTDVVYRGVVKIELNNEPLSAKIEIVKASENDDARWQAVVQLTNISNTNHYSGEIKMKEPERFVGAARKFSDIAPGETAVLKVNIPELVYKRPENMICDITLNNGTVITVSQKVDFTTAEYAAIKPTLDGKISSGEWHGSILCEDRSERITQSSVKAWKGKDDLSLEMHLLWDEKYLYVAAEVKDDVYTMNGNVNKMWDGDCVQIGIVEKVAGIENTASAFTELALGEADGKAKIYRYSHIGGNPETEVVDFNGCVKRDGCTTIYEYAIPWSELFEQGHIPAEGSVYGFSVCVNDADNGARHQWLNYNDGIGSTKDASKFGKLTLLSK